jgi:hypothetical protein
VDLDRLVPQHLEAVVVRRLLDERGQRVQDTDRDGRAPPDVLPDLVEAGRGRAREGQRAEKDDARPSCSSIR